MALLATAACGNKQTSKEDAPTTDSLKTDTLADETASTYFSAIDSYLISNIGSQYAKGDFCVPSHPIVAVDEKNPEDILVWGDFWVFNYNLAGDTLKTVSGGAHPGLMHIRQTEKGFEVTAFDQVEDGSSNLPSAKRIFGDKYEAFQAINSNKEDREKLRAEGLATYVKKQDLSATTYEDYGWPAKQLP
jgi:hypothetical protein